MRRVRLLLVSAICLIYALLDWFLGIPTAPSYAHASNAETIGAQGAICNTYVNGLLVSSAPCNGSGQGPADYHYIFVGTFVPFAVLALACLIASLLSEKEGQMVTKAAAITSFVPVVIVGLFGLEVYNLGKEDLIVAMATTAAIAWPIIYIVLKINASEGVATTAPIVIGQRTPPKASTIFKALLAILIWAWCISIVGEIILKREFGLSATSVLYTVLISLFWIGGIVLGVAVRKRSWGCVLIFCAVGVLLMAALAYLFPTG
jgi:hypothetical protein